MTAHRNGEVAESIARFALDLKIIRRQAGDPSYRQLAGLTRYSTATIARALKGDTLPGWPFTEKFLRACGCRPEEIARRRARWVEIMELLDPIPRPPGDAPMDGHQPADQVPGTECDVCGAWVTNLARHHEWHATFSPKLVVVTDGDQRKRLTYRPTG